MTPPSLGRFGTTVLLIVAGFTMVARAQQVPAPPPFRAAVDAVSLDVAVYLGNKPVAGLTAADFELTDNGVKQTPEVSWIDTMNVDLTLVFDASGSMENRIARLRADTRAVSAMLKPTDRLRLMTFATLVAVPFGLLPGAASPAVEVLEPGGATSFYNALVGALIVAQPLSPDRRQLVIAFSDGNDTTSFLNGSDVRVAAGQTQAVFHLFLTVGEYSGKASAGWLPYFGGPDIKELTAAAIATGGKIYTGTTVRPVIPAVKTVLDEFRTSYVLRYVASGVAANGWHDVAIRVTRPGNYTVRAKKRYFGGTEPRR